MATCIILALYALCVTLFVALSSAIPSPAKRPSQSDEARLLEPATDLSREPPRSVYQARPQLPPEILDALNRRLDKAA